MMKHHERSSEDLYSPRSEIERYFHISWHGTTHNTFWKESADLAEKPIVIKERAAVHEFLLRTFLHPQMAPSYS